MKSKIRDKSSFRYVTWGSLTNIAEKTKESWQMDFRFENNFSKILINLILVPKIKDKSFEWYFSIIFEDKVIKEKLSPLHSLFNKYMQQQGFTYKSGWIINGEFYSGKKNVKIEREIT